MHFNKFVYRFFIIISEQLQGKKITFGLVRDLEMVIREEGFPVMTSMTKCLSLTDPSATLPAIKNLLRKVERHVKKNGDLDVVITDLYPPTASQDDEYIGPACAKAGVTVSSLTKSDGTHELTEMMVAEIEIFRENSGYSFAAAKNWIVKLTGSKDCILVQTLRSSLVSKKEKMRLLTRNKEVNKLELMSCTPFALASKPSTSTSSSNIDTSKFKTKVNELTVENKTLCQDLHGKDNLLFDSYATVSKLEKQLDKMIRTSSSQEETLLKMEQELAQKKRELKQVLGHYKPSNVDRRDAAQKIRKRELHDENIQLSRKVQQLQTELQSKQIMLDESNLSVHKLQRSRRRFKNISKKLQTTETIVDKISTIKRLQIEKSELRQEFDMVVNELEEKQVHNALTLFVGEGMHKGYTDEVHECFMDISQYVSAKNISKVVTSVLSILGKFDVTENDFPKSTFCKLVRQEANIVSSRQVGEELLKTTYATQHSDGTSRNGQKVVDFEMTMESGATRTIGLVDVAGGDAETQLDALKFTLSKLSDLLDDDDTTDSKTEIFNKLISKIKNTMGDQAAAEKAFNHKLEQFRAEILPEIVENWKSLSDFEQSQMRRVNHFYCNLHALIGFADYSDGALKSLEQKWRDIYGKLGVETLREFQNKAGEYSWSHSDSAVQRLIRTTCSAMCPGGDQKSGCAGHFLTYRREILNEDHLEIRVFRANRFNILFESAAGLYYHRTQIKDMFLNGYVKASNKLLRAVLADIQSVPLLAGVRALGILHRQFTDQFWRIMESPDIHIIDLGRYIKTAYDALGKWKDDASPLLEKDMSPIFVKPDGDVKPKKDHVFDSLYAEAGDEMNMLTKQALEACCARMFVVMERRYSDYLEGKYSGDVSEEVYNETRKTLKTNKVGENDLGFWDWVKKNSESIGVMAAEGKVMFKRNKTATWLRQLKIHNNDRYKMVMKQARTKGRRWAKQYQKRSLGNERVKAARLEANRKNHEEMKNKLLKQHKERAKFVAKYGVLKSGNDVENVMKTFKSNAAKTKALKTYICFVKDLHHQQLANTVDKSLWVFSQKGKQLSVSRAVEH